MNIKCAYTDLIKLDDLKPYPHNENNHTEKQIKALAKIIAKIGQRSAIVVSKRSGFITKGHGRLAALKLLGWEKAAVDIQEYDSELEELNDRVADNEISKYAEFNNDLFLDNLGKLDIDMSSLDFEEFGLLDFELPKQGEGSLPDLGNGSDPDCQQMTFILSNYQADKVNEAISKMKKDELFKEDGINSNKNGTALALICEQYV